MTDRSILEELKAEEEKLRGIRSPKGAGNGHNFGKSKLARQLDGESGRAPDHIYDENMSSEENKPHD